VIVGKAAVHQDGLLDEPLAHHAREEVHVFLGPAGAGGDVVIPGGGVVDVALLRYRCG